MKKSYRIVALLLVFSLFILGMNQGEKPSVSKSKYWLRTGHVNVDKGTVIFLGNKLKLKGKWGKGSTRNSAENKYLSHAKTINKTIKFAKNCKGLGLNSIENDKTYPLDEYLKKQGDFKVGKKMEFMSLFLCIENNKIKRISIFQM